MSSYDALVGAGAPPSFARGQHYEQRRQRKYRTARQVALGRDNEGLREQMEENKRKAEEEREQKRLEGEAMVQLVEHMKSVQAQEDAQRRSTQLQLAQYWKRQIKTKSGRPEWDLNDPRGLRKDQPPSPAVAGVSSAQFLSHEDPREELRKRQLHQRSMLHEQSIEVEAQRQREREERAQEAQAVRDQVAARKAVEDLEARSRARGLAQTQVRNSELAALRRQQNAAEDAAALGRACQEHAFIEGNPMLRESRDNALALGGRGVVRQEWKGMTPEQLAAITDEQERQRREKDAQRARARECEQALDDAHERNRQHAVRMHAEEEAMRKEAALATQRVIELQDELARTRRAEQRASDLAPQPEWFPFGQQER